MDKNSEQDKNYGHRDRLVSKNVGIFLGLLVLCLIFYGVALIRLSQQ